MRKNTLAAKTRRGFQHVAVLTVLAATPMGAHAQMHPSKQVYLDWQSWPVTQPDAVNFSDGFQPFRAVWSREYRNMNGEMRTDRVVLVAEELAWYGRPVISLTLHDAGALDASDTNARTTSVFVDRETLSLIRATGPKSGTPEDYDVVAVRDGRIITTTVTTATGSAETKEFASEAPVFAGFNLDFLVWAGLGLKSDTRAVTQLFSPGANGLIPSIIRVVGYEEVQLPNGERVNAWVVERPINTPGNGRMHHFRILDRPPYLVSRHVIDLDTDETSFHYSLLEWETLGNQ